MDYDVVDVLRLAIPLATVLIKRREDNLSRFAFAGKMFRLNAATPVLTKRHDQRCPRVRFRNRVGVRVRVRDRF